MVTSIISSIFSVLLVGFAITSEVFLTPRGFWLGDWRSYDYRSLGIVLSAIQLLIGLLEFAIAIAASVCSCRVVCSGSDHSGSVHPGVVHSGSVYPGSVYPGSVYPGVYGSANQFPGSMMQSPQNAAPQMAAPQNAAPHMISPKMDALEMAAPKLDENQIQIQEV